MTLLREYTTALYALLHGDTVTTHGRYVHLDDVALDWPPAVVPPLLVGGIRPRTIALAGELADGLILTGEVTPDDVRTALGHFHRQRGRGRGRPTSWSSPAAADGPAAAIAATVSEYARAGATHIAVNAAEGDANLEQFVRFLAREVNPRLA